MVVTPLNVHSYLPIEQERKLAAALAPVISSTSMNHPHSSQSSGAGDEGNGNDLVNVSEEEFLEAATAGT